MAERVADQRYTQRVDFRGPGPHEVTGLPLGGDRFVSRLESTVGRLLRPQKPGRKRKAPLN